MKYIITLLLLFSCNTCYGLYLDIDETKPDEVAINESGREPLLNGIHQLQRCDLVIIRRLNKMEDTLDKMFSLMADLHIKEMGVKRFEQICPRTESNKVTFIDKTKGD